MAECDRCHEVGTLLGTEGELARAEVCSCQAECTACRGRGVTFVVQQGYEVAQPCACASLRSRVRCFNGAGLPARYADKTLDGFVAGTRELGVAKEKAMRYQRSFSLAASRGMVFVGEPGTGKTHLLGAIVGYLTLQCGIPARFIDFYHLTARLRASYDGEAESESDLLEPLVEVPVLAIDELGKGRGTAWELSIVDQLITRRYNAGRVMLGTSNYLPEAWLEGGPRSGAGSGGKGERWVESLEERIGRRAYSRLAEMCDVVAVRGPDYRTRPPSTSSGSATGAR